MMQEPFTDPYHNPRGGFTFVNAEHILRKHLDIAYDVLSDDQKLDIYLPDDDTAGALPVVVYIHGGGFEMGDRKYGHIQKLLDALPLGYAVASVSYRLSQEAKFPAAVQDVRNAIRYLRKHAADYGIDASRIGVFGESAGGNLAALLAMNCIDPLFDSHIPDALQGVSANVQACVDWFGVINMRTAQQQNEENNLRPSDRPSHFTPESCPESRYFGRPLYEVSDEYLNKCNPVTFISSQMCPMLIEHGTGDYQVAVQQSQELYKAIVERQGREHVELFLLEGAVHEDPRFERDENMAAVWKFFEKHLK